MPAISIVLPVYNAESFLDHCMEMLVGQDFADFEIIAVNDGSSDQSQLILEKWAAVENRLKIVSQENQGPGAARNIGMDKVCGEYVLFLDPDDAFDPSFLTLLHQAAKSYNADIAICGSSILDLESNKVSVEPWTLRFDLIPSNPVFSGADIADDLFRFTIGWPWDKLIKLDFLKRIDLRFPDIKNSEDGALIFPALCLAKRITVVRKPLVQHTMNRPTSLSFSRKNNALCFFDAIRLVKSILIDRDVYSVFERAYMNWALNFCLWNLDTAHPDDQEQIYHFIKETGFAEMKIFAYPEEFFYVPQEYRSAELIMKYHYPECMKIAQLEFELDEIRSSRSYRLGELLAGPLRRIREFFESRKSVALQKRRLE